jgi:hypothetical protein
MRITMTVVLAALTVAFAVPAFADLQNVKVGGSLRIRGSYYTPAAVPVFGEEDGNKLAFVEQRTRLNVTADFTNDVTAFIELDSWDVWGEDFRSDYITGVDGRAGTGNDVEVYQGYIETRETFGYPITARIGRQEIMLGSEWLVGNNDTSSFYQGLSFDGITLKYGEETWSIMALWAKLAENSPIEEDGDVDMYGVYASLGSVEDWTFDAYWLYIRDGRGSRLGFPFDTPNVGLFPDLTGATRNSGRLGDVIEDIFSVDQYEDTSNIHTVGLRGAGSIWGLSVEAEVAYQWGDATNAANFQFRTDGTQRLTGPTFLPIIGAFPVFGGPYAEDDAEYDAIGANLQIGYTFDTSYQPNIWVGAAYFEGEDNREEGFGDYLRSLFPFYEREASISFNRLFSDWEYSEFLDSTELSNSIIFRAGGGIKPTEATKISLAVSYFMAAEETYTNGIWGVPFFSYEHDDTMGLEAAIYFDYAYSEDLNFQIGYAHFFADDGTEDGNFINGNGLFLTGGSFGRGIGAALRSIPEGGDEDADYLYAETSIKF